jgi:hypothetical protein
MTSLLRHARAWRLCAATAVFVATMAAPCAARAFCRTTTTPIPASYSPTRGCFTDGLPLFWKGACTGYSVNTAASKQIPFDTATAVIDAAFATWNEVTCDAGPVGIAASNVGPVECGEVRYNPNGPNQNVIVFRDDVWPYSDPNNTLGLTTVTFNADTGEIYDADMELNATGRNLSTTDAVPVNGFDLSSVVTHEAGHFLGLAHATDSTATMYASYKPGTSALRSLSPDDIAGICEIYPTPETRNVDKSVDPSGQTSADACDPSPRHGFGSVCTENPSPASSSDGSGCSVVGGAPRAIAGLRDVAVGSAVLGLALAAASRRRRRRS